MKSLSRSITFLLFVCFFFVTAGFVVFYTLGYRFNAERGVFVYTGSLTIQSNPENVDIVIDGKSGKSNISQLNGSYHIAGLKPGEHFVEVSAQGYSTWTKRFIINSGVSTEFWNVMLTRTTYPETTYSTLPVSKAFPSPKSTLFAYVSATNQQGFSINTLDTETNESDSLIDIRDYSFDTDDKENIEWSIGSDYLSIPAIQDGRNDYFIVNSETKEFVKLKDIAQLDDLRFVRWDSSRNRVLFVMSGNTLYEINFDNPSDKKIVAQNVQSYDISGSDLYILESPNNIVYKASVNNPNARTQITATSPSDNSDPRYSVIAYDENRIMLINYFTGKLFAYNKIDADTNFSELSSGALGAQFSDDGKKILFWTDREISVYFTRKWETQPTREANSMLSIGRFSQPIGNVHWVKDYEHATFSLGDRIKLIELDNRGERSIMDVITLPDRPFQILSNFSENMLFYTVSDTQGQHTFHSIEFPEKITGFLGITQK